MPVFHDFLESDLFFEFLDFEISVVFAPKSPPQNFKDARKFAFFVKTDEDEWKLTKNYIKFHKMTILIKKIYWD